MTTQQISQIEDEVRESTQTMPEAVVGVGTAFTSSTLLSSHNLLFNSDLAFRKNPSLAENMRRDPVVTRATQVREGTLAGMPWKIKTDDETDIDGVCEASAVEAAIRLIPEWSQAIQTLARFSWFGISPVSMRYAKRSRPIETTEEIEADNGEMVSGSASVGISPIGWMPIHPDSTLFDDAGAVAIRVNRYRSEYPRERIVSSFYGTAVKLNEGERASLIMPVWGKAAPVYDDVETADRLYRGEGLRSHVWQAWYRRQLIDQAATHYAERLARGSVLIMYNGAAGLEQAKEIARSMATDFVTLVPESALGDKDPEKLIRIVEPTGTGYQIFGDLKEKADGEIANVIVPATLTMDAGATGMGSGVAAAHENTVQTVIDLDAQLMADALTRDLVGVIHRLNFPNSTHRLRWCYPEVEAREKRRSDGQDDSRLDQALKLVQMGVRISEDEVRSLAGFRRAKPGEPVAGDLGGGVGGGIDDLLNGFGSGVGV